MLALEACGALLIDDHGQIVAAGERDAVRRQAVGEFREIDHGEAWLLPGLVDGHFHFRHFYATAAYGRARLGWLARSIFPGELLSDPSSPPPTTPSSTRRRQPACA